MDIAKKMLGIVKQGFGSGDLAIGSSLIGYCLFRAWIKWRELKIRREVALEFLEFAGTLAAEGEKRNVFLNKCHYSNSDLYYQLIDK